MALCFPIKVPLQRGTPVFNRRAGLYTFLTATDVDGATDATKYLHRQWMPSTLPFH